MSEKIKPALTAEEWPSRLNGNSPEELVGAPAIDEQDGSLTVRDGDTYLISVPDTERHATAALALYNQPFGFAQGDVRALRDMCDTDDSEQESGRSDLTAIIRSIADRIEALLPPEEK